MLACLSNRLAASFENHLPGHHGATSVWGALVALILPPMTATAGLCLDDGLCDEPCPAENSCYADDDCVDGQVCLPGCLPTWCRCNEDGAWVCSLECAGACGERPYPAGPLSYTIIDLGTLGGPTSTAWDINDAGTIVGESAQENGSTRAFIWHRGSLQPADEGALSPISYSAGINAAGEYVVNLAAHPSAPYDALVSTRDDVIFLGGLGAGDTEAFAVNVSGQVVGASRAARRDRHAFLWESGKMQDLGTFGGDFSLAWDINEQGQVVGIAEGAGYAHAFLWDGSLLTDLGTLGGVRSVAFGLNNLGDVVGESERDDRPGNHAVCWCDGEMFDIGEFGASETSRANDINDTGLVVGWPHFLFDLRTLTLHDLHDLLPPDRGWYLHDLYPRAINHAGQIVGTGTFDGARRAFLMTPIQTDFDIDGDTDWTDYARLSACLGGPDDGVGSECRGVDINRNGTVDLYDLRVFGLFLSP